jgi:hypothetical protein
MYVCHSNTWEAEAGESQVQCQPVMSVCVCVCVCVCGEIKTNKNKKRKEEFRKGVSNFFSVSGQIINILGFVSCYCSRKQSYVTDCRYMTR